VDTVDCWGPPKRKAISYPIPRIAFFERSGLDGHRLDEWQGLFTIAPWDDLTHLHRRKDAELNISRAHFFSLVPVNRHLPIETYRNPIEWCVVILGPRLMKGALFF
jgi:hypothetical protein